jgi:5'-nucleotidase
MSVKRVIVDMDGVLANFELGVHEAFIKQYPEYPAVPLDQRRAFYVKDDYPKHLQPLIEAIYLEKGFYANLKPIEGALVALGEIASSGYEVFICTSPLLQNPYCIPEKYDWVARHLGREWLGMVIVAKDKTVVHGDYLIDDKSRVEGVQIPSWEHILFTQPYNQDLQGRTRITWQNWREVLDLPSL